MGRETWLRKVLPETWRNKQFQTNRASFQGEGVLLRLTNTNVRYHIRHQLRDGWAREIFCRRAVEAGAAVSDGLRKGVLNASIETLIATNWAWYEPLMFARRRAQMEAAGDRQDILAIDGNCKLHRRTCGMPFAEVIASPYLNKLLLRGCSAMPHGRDTLCCKRAGDRDRPQQPRAEQVGRHRLKRALHSQGDVCHLEIQTQGHGGWQPACAVKEEALAKYFASQADRNIRRRRERRVEARSQKWAGFRPRRARTFLAPWHSIQPRQTSTCSTHKESAKDVHAASKDCWIFVCCHRVWPPAGRDGAYRS
ncbi:unnamed protein product [Durusdinium trenchii]|uniref:Uncharacterized protein n=2 Tax=Durusdinium trenchii TaxID=1381693 RepID=A0ABP0RP06_9DINO